MTDTLILTPPETTAATLSTCNSYSYLSTIKNITSFPYIVHKIPQTYLSQMSEKLGKGDGNDRLDSDWPWVGRYPGLWFSFSNSPIMVDIDNHIYDKKSNDNNNGNCEDLIYNPRERGTLRAEICTSAITLVLNQFDLSPAERQTLLHPTMSISRMTELKELEQKRDWSHDRTDLLLTAAAAGIDAVRMPVLGPVGKTIPELVVLNTRCIKRLDVWNIDTLDWDQLFVRK